jgi:hypothetical protein
MAVGDGEGSAGSVLAQCLLSAGSVLAQCWLSAGS